MKFVTVLILLVPMTLVKTQEKLLCYKCIGDDCYEPKEEQLVYCGGIDDDENWTTTSTILPPTIQTTTAEAPPQTSQTSSTTTSEATSTTSELPPTQETTTEPITDAPTEASTQEPTTTQEPETTEPDRTTSTIVETTLPSEDTTVSTQATTVSAFQSIDATNINSNTQQSTLSIELPLPTAAIATPVVNFGIIVSTESNGIEIGPADLENVNVQPVETVLNTAIDTIQLTEVSTTLTASTATVEAIVELTGTNASEDTLNLENSSTTTFDSSVIIQNISIDELNLNVIALTTEAVPITTSDTIIDLDNTISVANDNNMISSNETTTDQSTISDSISASTGETSTDSTILIESTSNGDLTTITTSTTEDNINTQTAIQNASETVPNGSADERLAIRKYNAAAKLLRSYRAISRLQRDTEESSFACYSIKIKVDDNQTIQRGCIRFESDNNPCDTVKEKFKLDDDDGCVDICKNDRCNRNAAIANKLSLGCILSLLALKVIFF